MPTTNENDEGKMIHAHAKVLVEPGTKGFSRAFVDELSGPFDCDTELLADLPVHEEG